ncbi:Aldehyde dehydrogenase NAD(P)-dependent [Penicillium macrosclerotiorum]|uniref:Aldehyde dehydrogenase NAD(P)-dependent n=1 Tax=Penicillium macrosclerotiorum TaxID=303699 RepID=UPI002548D5AA|nr:Aldehyde dehydrogenase NAD(P)-dependent [Penicillium macrosclerotiorum]KAJ5699111.1 Aldehyde dehydrogenase NAD(P)-dependent [Penicillium macrosclerotiorum]
MGFSTTAEFDQAYQGVRKAFTSGVTKNKEWRRQQLKRTWWMVEDNMDRIRAALYADLHRHAYETGLSDVAMLQNDILRTLDKLDEWTKDEIPTRRDMVNFLGGTRVRKEPKGVALIIGAWNFPILLLLQPMIAAIAAGCAIILKPSDMAIATQDLLMEIIPKYLDQEAIRCITAGPREMSYVLDQRYDHIFYTGSGHVGKIVHAAAAKHLTPVTLELGGLAPAIVTAAANVELSGKHIAATKFSNAGQICLNVNHVIVDPTVRQSLVDSLTRHFDVFMGGKGARPEYYTHIINERNFDRLERLLEATSGQIVYGGHRDRDTRFFAPTIVTGVKPGDALLSEELGTTPLAIYAFTEKQAEKNRILDETQSGGVTFNDCTLHVVARDAPFGGIGASGQGYYHGSYGIREFSYLRTHVDAMPTWMEALMDARYPPYSIEKLKKIVSATKPSFDREGRDISRGTTKWVLGLGALVLSVAMVTPRQQVQSLVMRVINGAWS